MIGTIVAWLALFGIVYGGVQVSRARQGNIGVEDLFIPLIILAGSVFILLIRAGVF